MKVVLIILKLLGKTVLKLLSIVVYILFLAIAILGGIASSVLQKVSALAILVLIILFIAGNILRAGPLTLLLFVPPTIGLFSVEIVKFMSKKIAVAQIFLSEKSSYKNVFR